MFRFQTSNAGRSQKKKKRKESKIHIYEPSSNPRSSNRSSNLKTKQREGKDVLCWQISRKKKETSTADRK